METTSILISLGILAYGAVAYVQREKDHRKTLESVRNGEEVPPPARSVSPWKLVTTGGTALLLLATAGAILRLGLRGSPTYAIPYVVMALAALPPAALLGMILHRDYRLLKSGGADRKEASQ
jgi:hypothetical protein